MNWLSDPAESADAFAAKFRSSAEHHFYAALTVLIAWIVLWRGLGVMPREPYRLTAMDPFNAVEAYPQNYFQASPLLPLLGHFTHLVSSLGYSGLAFAIFVIAVGLLGVLARRRNGGGVGLLSVTLLLGHPATTTCLSWLGSPDSLTILFTVLFIFARRPIAVFALAALGAFNHPMMYFIAPALLLLRYFADEDINARHWLAGFTGLALGGLLVVAFLTTFGIHTYSRLDFMQTRSPMTWLKMNVSNFPMTVYSLHQLIWVPLLLSIAYLWNRRRSLAVAIPLVQIVFYGVTFFNADTTRVFATMAWAPALMGILYAFEAADARRDGNSVLQQMILGFSLLALAVPQYYIWASEIHPSSFDEFYRAIIAIARSL